MYKVIIFYITVFSLLFSFSNNNLTSSESYVVGEDGVIRMYVNIIGHVKNPGVYFLYDGIDLYSAISHAGGYLPGSALSNIKIINSKNEVNYVDLNKYSKNINLVIKPHDTIVIEEKILSKILTSSNLPYIILGILNVALTIQNSD